MQVKARVILKQDLSEKELKIWDHVRKYYYDLFEKQKEFEKVVKFILRIDGMEFIPDLEAYNIDFRGEKGSDKLEDAFGDLYKKINGKLSFLLENEIDRSNIYELREYFYAQKDLERLINVNKSALKVLVHKNKVILSDYYEMEFEISIELPDDSLLCYLKSSMIMEYLDIYKKKIPQIAWNKFNPLILVYDIQDIGQVGEWINLSATWNKFFDLFAGITGLANFMIKFYIVEEGYTAMIVFEKRYLEKIKQKTGCELEEVKGELSVMLA